MKEIFWSVTAHYGIFAERQTRRVQMSEMLQGMITEDELSKLLNLKPRELRFLRAAKGLPYGTKRVYLEEDLMNFFKSHRTVADVGNI